MPFVVILLVLLVASVVGVVVVGASLPEAHTVTLSETVTASVPTVWAAISDLSRWPEWNRRVTSVEKVPSDRPHPRWRTHGPGGALTYDVTEANEARAVLVTQLADPSLPFGGFWSWHLEPTAEGCRVIITENGFVKNPVFRFVSRFVLGHEKSARDTLTELRAHAPALRPR